ncbi:uncharacterized protein LOC109861819, partial [Pseudomyrmex gracilis]|uniref:uncharacterized protein LOC109861819 n=1 Tax=Pseudomyrmex gracilis TaxID=219809 RepID=UPI000995C586
MQWLDRRHGKVTYRLTQMLSGHGCFEEYLHRIGKRPTAQCRACDAASDSAQHTLEECPAWAEERRVLVASIGEDLSLPAVVRVMVGGKENWKAVAFFCEQVMLQKEADEREWERAP